MANPRRTAKGPLRKVMGEVWEEVNINGSIFWRHCEKLECGHIQRIPTDIYGEFYSARRRCRECYKMMHPLEDEP